MSLTEPTAPVAKTEQYFGADLAVGLQQARPSRRRHHYRTATLLPVEGRESCKVWVCAQDPAQVRRATSLGAGAATTAEPLAQTGGAALPVYQKQPRVQQQQQQQHQGASNNNNNTSVSRSAREEATAKEGGAAPATGLHLADGSSRLPECAHQRTDWLEALATSAPSTPQNEPEQPSVA